MISMLEWLRRRRSSTAVVLAAATLLSAVVWAHSGWEHPMPEEDAAEAVATLCLAVLNVGGALALGAIDRRWRSRTLPKATPQARNRDFIASARLGLPSTRAGPEHLQVFLR